MPIKKIFKISIDISMTVFMLIEMAYQLTEIEIHEWIGVVLFILFFIHNILNYKWYKTIFKGKYNINRIINTSINIILLFLMTGIIISGIMLSQVVFTPISSNIEFDMMLIKKLHMLFAYWGYILMSLHVGMHWGIILNMMLKPKRNNNKFYIYFLRFSVVLIVSYGIYAFFINEFHIKLIAPRMFGFWDYSTPAVRFFTDYLAVMGIFVALAYYGKKITQKSFGKKKKQQLKNSSQKS